MSKSKKKQAPKMAFTIIFFILSLLAGFIIGRLFLSNMKAPGKGTNNLPMVFIILTIYILSFYVQMILHEAGHLIFGLLTGYRFLSFRIASFMWVKDNGKIRFCRYTLAGTGGQCLLAPPEWTQKGIPYVWYNLGGVIMNLLCAVIGTVLYFFVSKDGLPGTVFICMIIVGIILALLNGLPLKTESVNNDGHNIVAISKNKDSLRAWWLMMKINEDVTYGIRLKDMPDTWFEIPAESTWKNVMQVDLAVFHANRLLDQGKIDECRELITRLFDADTAMQGIYRWMLGMDLVYCELLGEQKADIIENFNSKELKQLQSSMSKFPSVIRTQYAYYLLAKKDEKEANLYRSKFDKIAKNYPYRAEIASETELMEKAKQYIGAMKE